MYWCIYVSGNYAIIGSGNSLLPVQAINWTDAVTKLIEPFGSAFIEILIKIHKFSYKNMSLKMPSTKWHLIYPSLNVLKPKTLDVGLMIAL